MIWRDHVFNYGPKTATRVTKFREKTGEALAETVFLLKFCHPRSRFWGPKLKTWSCQIMFYVIYLKAMEILGKFLKILKIVKRGWCLHWLRTMTLEWGIYPCSCLKWSFSIVKRRIWWRYFGMCMKNILFFSNFSEKYVFLKFFWIFFEILFPIY